jgi:hypothetical protein
MNELEVIIDRNGPLMDVQPVPDEVIAAYRGKVPGMLLEFWETQGTGSWVKGLFNVCTPGDFDGLLSQVFHADKDFSHADCHIFGYSAFGIIFAWSERHGVMDINLLRNEVIASGLTKEGSPGPSKNALTALLFRLTKDDSLDAYDDDDNKLFSRTVKTLGRPGPGQAFGFFPALTMGGAPKLENIKIVPALEHFLFLAQLQQFQLVDYLSQPPRVVRSIG